MDEIEVVIRIPEEWIEQFKAFKHPSTLETIILQGIVLPKGHGRLIDADNIKYFNNSWTKTQDDWCVRKDDIDKMPTILEAEVENDR